MPISISPHIPSPSAQPHYCRPQLQAEDSTHISQPDRNENSDLTLPKTAADEAQPFSHCENTDPGARMEDCVQMGDCVQMQLEQTDKELSSSLANYIKRLLPDENLDEFDRLRVHVKGITKTKSALADDLKWYNCLQTMLGMKVLSRQKEIDEQLEDLKRCYFQQHEKLPCKHTNIEYHDLLKEKKLATAILRNMNIKF